VTQDWLDHPGDQFLLAAVARNIKRLVRFLSQGQTTMIAATTRWQSRCEETLALLQYSKPRQDVLEATFSTPTPDDTHLTPTG
jgi:hypothetical protein